MLLSNAAICQMSNPGTDPNFFFSREIIMRVCKCNIGYDNIRLCFQGALSSSRMARGHQKAQSQAKAQEKAAKMKKQQGHNANEQKKAAEVALKSKCSICMVSDIAGTFQVLGDTINIIKAISITV